MAKKKVSTIKDKETGVEEAIRYDDLVECNTQVKETLGKMATGVKTINENYTDKINSIPGLGERVVGISNTLMDLANRVTEVEALHTQDGNMLTGEISDDDNLDKSMMVIDAANKYNVIMETANVTYEKAYKDVYSELEIK